MAVTVAPYDNANVWGPVVVIVSLVLANLLCWALNEQSWPYRHLLSRAKVPKMLFISNRAAYVPKSARPQSYWGFDVLDPKHMVQSPVLPTVGLLVLHACTFLYSIATVMVDVVVEYYGYGCTASWCYRRSGTYLEWMTYLTNWSISLLGLSGLVAFINTARHMRRQRHWRKQQQQQQQQQQGGVQQPQQQHVQSPLHGHTQQQQQQGLQQEVGGVELGSWRGQQQAQYANGNSAANPGFLAVSPARPTAVSTVRPAVVPTAVNVVGYAARSAGGQGRVSHSSQPDAVMLTPLTRDQATPQQQQQQKQKHSQHHVVLPATQPMEQQHGADHADGACSSSSSSVDTVVQVNRQGGAGDSKVATTTKWDWLAVLHCILAETATAAAFFVSFWFWVGLVGIAGQPFRANGGTLMAHGGNFVLALAQLLLTRLPVVSTHFQVLLWYASLYMIFLFAFGGGSGEWRYGLDWQKAKPAGALILVPLIVFIFFALWFLVARAREGFIHKVQHKRARHHEKKAQRSAAKEAAAAHPRGVAAV